MARELVKSYTKKDFDIDWYSGSGAGGQHRNKHQNCCRITHIETGLRAQGTESRERTTNQRVAFERLARLLIAKDAQVAERRTTDDTIRNYHGVRNEVHDKASGLKLPYREIVDNANLAPMIEARRIAMAGAELSNVCEPESS